MDRNKHEVNSWFFSFPCQVIWRHKGERPSTLGNNTLLVDWMPQKDLLGHPQTKVFVAHGGTNGVQEAIYHGVPVLGIPLFFDQYDNLLRLQERGAGKIIELGDVNRHSFEQGINEVLHQDSYRQNMQRLSRLHRDQPMAPMDQAIFWVEYVMRHKGAPHLRTEAYKMPWYSYYCLDVLLLLLTVATVLLFSTVAIFRFLCCRSRRKTKTKQHWYTSIHFIEIYATVRLEWALFSDKNIHLKVSFVCIYHLLNNMTVNAVNWFRHIKHSYSLGNVCFCFFAFCNLTNQIYLSRHNHIKYNYSEM